MLDDLAEAKSLIERGEYERGLPHLVEAARSAVAHGKSSELREVVELAGIVSRHSGGWRRRQSERLRRRAEQRLAMLDVAGSAAGEGLFGNRGDRPDPPGVAGRSIDLAESRSTQRRPGRLALGLVRSGAACFAIVFFAAAGGSGSLGFAYAVLGFWILFALLQTYRWWKG